MRTLIVVTIVLSIAAVAAAQTTPATAPAADFSTPKATARSLFHAITAGDRDTVRAALYAEDDAQRDLAAAMADVIVAGKELGAAAKQKFGAAGDPIGRGMLEPSDLGKIEEATVIETAADAAVMTVPDQPRPMSFRKQGEQWKLVVTDFGGAAPENVTKQTKLVRAMADAVAAAAAEIAAGKYKTPDEATFAIQQSLHQVMLSFYRPSTTRSATNPSTTQASTREAVKR